MKTKNITGISNVKLYPNPSADVLNTEFVSTKKSTTIFYITDVLGKIVFSTNYPLEYGLNSITLPINNLSAGVYNLTFIKEGKKMSMPFINK